MNYVLSKGHVSRKRLFEDIRKWVFIIISIIYFAIASWVFAGIAIKEAQEIDEVKVTGPNNFQDFATKKHPMIINTNDGKYTITIVEP